MSFLDLDLFFSNSGFGLLLFPSFIDFDIIIAVAAVF